MIIYIFDLDDTIIKHIKNAPIDYINIKKNLTLNDLLHNCKCDEKYIFTNGTDEHAKVILNNMEINNHFRNIFSRDNFQPYLKPDIDTYLFVEEKINYQRNNQIYFFDDLLINLKMAKELQWITILIHSKFTHVPDYIDYSFPNIYQALLFYC